MPDVDDDLFDAPAPPRPRKMVRGMEKLKGVQPDLLNHWNNLQTEFDKAGVVPTIKSGYRSAEQQNSLHRRGYPTKGNDGYINISPHQDGRSLDLGFNAAQKETGRRIIADYAKRNNLHVPSDEPWHIAIPKAQQKNATIKVDDLFDAPDAVVDDDLFDTPTAKTKTAPIGTVGTNERGATKPDAYMRAIEEARAAQSKVPQITGGVRGIKQPSGAGALRQIDDPEVARIQKMQRQVASEPNRRANARLLEGSLPDAEEAAKRASEDKQQETVAIEQEKRYQKDKPEIDRLSKLYRTAIRGGKLGGVQWGSEAVAKGIAPLVEKFAGIGGKMAVAGGAPGAQAGVDALHIHAQALQQAAMEEGADRTEASKFVQDIAGGFIGTAPELAAMSVGVPAPIAFAAGSGAQASGSGQPVLPAIAHGAATGAAFEIPGVGQGIKRVVTKAGAVGAGTTGVELATGATPREAAVTGLTNAAMVGLPGVVHHSSGQPRRTRNTATGAKGQFKSGKVEQPTEATVPEAPETLAAQVDALKSGTRDAVLLTPGEKRPAIPPRTSTVKTDVGLWYYNPAKVDANTIKAKVADGSHGELIGYVAPKPEVGEPTAVVTATKDGVEVQSSAVPPEKVSEQVAATKAQNPDARVQVGDESLAAKVIQDRLEPAEAAPAASPERQPEVASLAGRTASTPEVSPSVREGELKARIAEAERQLDADSFADLPDGAEKTSRMKAWRAADQEHKQARAELYFEQGGKTPSAKEVEAMIARLRDDNAPWTDKDSEALNASRFPELANRTAPSPQGEVKQSPQQIIEAEGLTYKGEQALNRAGDKVGQMFDTPDGSTLMITGEVTPESVRTKLAEHSAKKGVENVIPTVTQKALEVVADTSGRGSLAAVPPSTKPSFVQAALDRKAAREAEKAKGIEYRHSGVSPEILLDDIIVRGHELYTEKVKPTFNEWAKKIKAEFADAKDKDLRDIYAQLSGDATSIKNSALAADREALGLSTLSEAEHVSWQKSLDTAKERKLDGDQADRTAQRILDGKQKVLDVDESAGLELRIRDLQNQHQKLTEQAWKETDPTKLATLRDEANVIKDKYDSLSDAAKQAGTGLARAFAFRRSAINENYDLVSMERDFKVQTGKDATGNNKTTIERLNKEIVELTKQVETAKAESAKLETAQAVKRIARDVARETREARRNIKKGDLDAEADQLKQLIAAAWKKAGRRGDIAGMAAVDPEGELIKLVLKLARNRVKKGAVTGVGLVDDIHGLLQDVTDLDKRRVAEIISGYGRKGKQQSPLQQQLNTLKAELRQGLTADDIAAGKRTAKREGPPTPPKLGPKDSWPTRQKQIEKQIAELETAIEQGRQGVFTEKAVRGETVLTPEAQRLVDRLEAKKNEFQNLKRRNEPGAGWRNASALRKAWMLSWIKTHVRNIAGTALYQPFDELSRPISASVDAVVGLRFGGERTVQGLSPSAAIDALWNGAVKEGGKEFSHVMRHGATREQMELHQFTDVDVAALPVLKHLPQKGINAINIAHNSIYRFMSGSDRVFWNQAYRRNLIDRTTIAARNEKRNDPSVNVKQRAKELESDPSIEADAKADAYVSTLNNNNALSTAVKAFRATATSKLGPKNGALANFAIDLFLPFDRTPTNVIARVLEASPVGFYKAATKGYKEPLNPLAAARDIVNGSMTKEERRQFATAVGHAGLGSAMMTLAYNLVPKGILEVDEKDNVFINVRGHKINISLLSPIGQVFAIGARLAAKQMKGELTAGAATKIAGRTLADQPMLRATSQATELIRDPERSAGKTGASLAFSAVPFSSAARGVGELLDPADRRYPDNSFTEQFKRNAPILRESLPASRVRLLGSKVTPATKEVERLKIDIKGAVKQDDESPEDFQAREALENSMIRTQIENVVALPDYEKASDADKTAWLKQAARYARGAAKDQLPEKAEKPEAREFPMPQSKGFDRAFPDQALKRYEKLSPAKRAAVYNAMAEKAWLLLNSPTLSDEEKAKYKERLDAVGVTPRAPNTPVPSLGSQYKSGVQR